MAALHDGYLRASLLFVCNVNVHHQERLGSAIMNHHGVAAIDFVTFSRCGRLVVGSTNARGETLDLLMTDIPDLVQVAVVAQV